MANEEVGNGILMFKFKNLQKLVFNKANKYMCKKGTPIPFEQIPVLMTIFYRGTLSQQEIADNLDRDKSSVLRSIKSLIIKGLINIAQDPFDKRKKMIQLTKDGNVLGASINESILEVDKMVFSALTEDEKNTLEELLIKCIKGNQ